MLNVLHQKRRRIGQLADKRTRVISQIGKDLASHIKHVTYVSICNKKNDITGFWGVWNRHQPMPIHQMTYFYLKPIFVLRSHIFHHDVLESEGSCLIQFGLFALELVLRCSLFGQVWDASDAPSDLNVLTWTVSLHFGFVPPTHRLFWTRAKRRGVKRNQNGWKRQQCFSQCFSFCLLLRTK